MPRRPLRRPPLAGIALLTVAFAVAPAAAAPPPQELCGVCGDEFAETAAEAGVPLTIERSAATITLREDGSARWNALVHVNDDAADRFAANESLREGVVRETYAHGRTLVDEPRNLTVRTDGDYLHVAFEVPGVSRAGPGGVVLTQFRWADGPSGSIELDADRVEIRGPDGTVVTSGVDGMETRPNAVVWEREGDERGHVASGSTLAFGPPGIGGTVATWIAILAVALSRVTPAAASVAAVPAGLLGVAVAALLGLDDRLPSVESGRLALGLVGIATVTALLAILSARSGAGQGMRSIALGAVLYGLLAAGPVAFDLSSPRRLAGWLALVVVLVPAALTLSGVAGGPAVASVAVPVAVAGLFLPLGATSERSLRLRAGLMAALLLVPFAAALSLLAGSGPGFLLFAGLAFLASAGVVVAIGAPLYVLGRASVDR